MNVRFCTLFDSRYATRGLVMLESLETYRRGGDEVIILAMDAVARTMVEAVNHGRWQVVDVANLADVDLLAAQKTRPMREFCWTCTPALAAWLVNTSADADIVVYLDADLMFFSDPRLLLAELDNDGVVLIHEHRYSPDRTAWAASSGRFNVGFVAFRVVPQARQCVERWRAQTLERCELDPEQGLCGDQGYLNEWPSLYPNLRIMRHLGGGVAPWNVSQYRVGRSGNAPTVEGQPVVFFHYHALQKLFDRRFGFVAANPAVGYQFPRATLDVIFRPYAQRLRRATRMLTGAGFAIEADRTIDRAELLYGIARGRYVSAI
jgi:hypothetical protein